RDVATHRPRALPVDVLGPGVRIDVLAHAAAARVLELHHPGELLLVDAALVDDGARRVGEGDHLGAQLQQLLHRELRHVARARHRDALATQVLAARAEHRLDEVDAAVAGRLGTDQRAAPGAALAGEHAGELVAQLLVHAEEVADLAPANADVARRHVGVGPDVPPQLGHEGLAETHHLAVGLALGVEVAAALAAAHRQRGEAVLEHLLEGEELEDAEVDAGVEAQAALVRPQRAAHLDAEAAVYLDVAAV